VSDWAGPRNVLGGNKPPVANSHDLQRVLALPRRPPPDAAQRAALVAYVTAKYARPPGPCRCAEMGRKCIRELRDVQAWALWEAEQADGLLGQVAVGAGKTLVWLLIAFAIRECRTALLLVPPNLVEQLVFDYQLCGQHFRMPTLVVHAGKNLSHTVPGTPCVHVFPYSRLSLPTSTAFVEQLAPDLIIADECDKLSNYAGAGASRVKRYMEHHPRTRFCGGSGSMTDKSLHDYAHLAAWSFKARSPLPLDLQVLNEWAEAIDAVDWPRDAGALLTGLRTYGLVGVGEDVRAGYRRRLHETPGFVYSAESPVSVPLTITERKAPPIPPVIVEALEQVRAFERPDGEELISALEVATCARQVACGFFYRWTFPHREPRDLIMQWLAARKLWRRELRLRLKDREEHLDSDHLCTQAAIRAWGDAPPDPLARNSAGAWVFSHETIRAAVRIARDDDGLPVWRAAAWPAWRDIADRVNPVTVAVRLDDFLARDAAAWASETPGRIVWYDSAEFGRWVAELSGLPLHGGGPNAGKRILDERGGRSIVASLNSHGRGRNGLQFHFAEQLVAEPPSSSKMWEQLVGRVHRPGQEAAEVRTWYYGHTTEVRAAYAQALTRAAYVEATTGAAQKIMIAGRR
jgi:hypothetical protein